jgi:hypothetical protein
MKGYGSVFSMVVFAYFLFSFPLMAFGIGPYIIFSIGALFCIGISFFIAEVIATKSGE